MMKDIEIFIILFTGSKNIDFSRSMSLRSWYFTRVNRVFQGAFLGTLTYKIQNPSPPRAFKTFTSGFRRCRGAGIAKKHWKPIFNFLIQEFFINILLLSKKNLIFFGFLLIKNHKIKNRLPTFFSQYQHLYNVENRE